MTSCGFCSAGVAGARRARVLVRADGSEAVLVCAQCSTDYPRKRLYKPKRLPSEPRVDLSDRGQRPAREVLAELEEGST